MNLLELVEKEQIRDDVPDFAAGDTVKAHIRVVEGGKERIQVFEGVCIKRSGTGSRENATIRKISNGIGVERVLMLHSPIVKKLEVVRRGVVRQSRIYYLRDRIGKAARIREKKF